VADDGSLKFTSEGGAHLVAEVMQDATGSTITRDGEERAFAADHAEEPAGLYRKVETVGGEELVGGWILLESGEERGAVKSRSSGFVNSGIEVARPSRPADGFMGSDIDF
jgi:hypothetical protein